LYFRHLLRHAWREGDGHGVRCSHGLGVTFYHILTLISIARIVQCKMILKWSSFPMQDDPEIGILPRCQVNANSDGKYGSAGAGSDRWFPPS
jgi:hypothetical protein